MALGGPARRSTSARPSCPGTGSPGGPGSTTPPGAASTASTPPPGAGSPPTSTGSTRGSPTVPPRHRSSRRSAARRAGGSRGHRWASSSSSTCSSAPSPTSCGAPTSTATLGPGATDLFAVEGPGGSGQQRLGRAGPAAGRDRSSPATRTASSNCPASTSRCASPAPSSTWSGFAFPGRARRAALRSRRRGGLGDHQRDGRLPGPLPRTAAPRRRPGPGPRGRTAGCRRDVHVETIEVRGGAPESGRGRSRHHAARSSTTTGAPTKRSACVPPAGSRRTSASTRCCRCCGPGHVDDVADALRGWVEPVNSVLVADTQRAACTSWSPGWCRSATTGAAGSRCPAGSRGTAGETATHRLTRTAVDGFAVYANDRRDDVADLGVDFAPPHRARRIRDPVGGRDAEPDVVHMDTRLRAAAAARRALPARPRRPQRPSPGPAGSADRLGRAHAGRQHRRRRLRGVARRPGRAGCTTTRACAPLRTPSAFDALFAPWTDPLARIGLALDGVVAGLHRLGGDIDPVAAAALEDTARYGPPQEWGRRAHAAPGPPRGGVGDRGRVDAIGRGSRWPATPTACSPPPACPECPTPAGAARSPATSGT